MTGHAHLGPARARYLLVALFSTAQACDGEENLEPLPPADGAVGDSGTQDGSAAEAGAAEAGTVDGARADAGTDGADACTGTSCNWAEADTTASLSCAGEARPELSACLTGPNIGDGGGAAYDSPLSRNFAADVVAAGQGTPPAPCFGYLGAGRAGQLGTYIDDEAKLAGARWATLQDSDGNQYTLGALVPDGEAALALAPGDAVSVDLRLQLGGFSPTLGALTVRDDSTGELLFWYAQAGGVEDLSSPDELAFGAGEATCEDKQSQCVERFEHREMLVQYDDTLRPLSYAGRADIGPLRVVSGGYEVQTGASLCTDAFVAWAAAAAWPR